jgi:hypothetical protein
VRPIYFNKWLSGFIEAKAYFLIKKFTLGHNNDYYLINMIKDYFKANNNIIILKNKVYCMEIYKKEVLLKIITHCTNYPLLGIQ